ncbi:hypothetical protein M422DRAFT_42009 [Sphaerobolus stellatus SS14]|nr:hypothetical protein M422DRAFT_42009 [Sphaerobolus stellatus SS14]
MSYHHDDYYEQDYKESTPECLTAWVTAEDLAHREESVYHRLKEYQGSLLPHSYGFPSCTCHFIKESCRSATYYHFMKIILVCIGFTMERIHRIDLYDAKLSSLPETTQKDSVLTIRHAFRVLLYSQVSQNDWHNGQIMVMSNGKRIDIVLIDFGFAYQYLDRQFAPLRRNWKASQFMVAVDPNSNDWDLWSPPDKMITEKFIVFFWFHPYSPSSIPFQHIQPCHSRRSFTMTN